MKSAPIKLSQPIIVNGHSVLQVVIGRHYRAKHAHYMNDDLVVGLVAALDGGDFPVDSVTGGVEYYAADISLVVGTDDKTFRLIWLFEGDRLEIIGVINAYRIKRKKNKKGG